MKANKWYVVQGQNDSGNYAKIKDEETDLIVAEFPSVDLYTANERLINLAAIVKEHNKTVKQLNALLPNYIKLPMHDETMNALDNLTIKK